VPAPDSWQAMSFSTLVTMQLARPLSAMVFSGALERHPGNASGPGRSRSRLGALCRQPMTSRPETAGNGQRLPAHGAPSEIFRQQVFITFEEERGGEAFVELVGAERCMWASDYPTATAPFRVPGRHRRVLRPAHGNRLPAHHRRQLPSLYRFEPV